MTSLAKNKDKKLIWVLKDDRPGNYSQAISLAKSLNFPYKIKEISYNKLAILPNFLKFSKLSTINQNSKNNLIKQKEIPDIIISAGRRSALIALDLKKIYSNVFLINIMNPGKKLIKKFDLIIAPFHDNLTNKNVISIPGAFTYNDQDLIDQEYKKFSNIFNNIKSPNIALLIGGSSKNAKFNQSDIVNFKNVINNISNNMKANLLVTTSRRTDDFITDELSKLDNISYFFKWQEQKENPYYAILKAADYIITTGDSISMCCEAINFQKPLYIYLGNNLCSKKHLLFHKNLFKFTNAKELSNNLNILKETKAISNFNLNEIIDSIKRNIKNQF